MFEDLPLPSSAELRDLIRKARGEQPFTGTDYRWIVNVLVTLEHDSMYQLKERMKRYEAEDRAKSR
jgi:hypothetical protein